MRTALALALALALVAPAAGQQALSLGLDSPRTIQVWPGPDSSRTPAGTRSERASDVDFVVSEACYPFVLQGEEPDAVLSRPGLTKVTRPDADDSKSNESIASIGPNADLTVTLMAPADGSLGDARICSIYAKHDNPTALYAAAKARLLQWPTVMKRVSAAGSGETFCGERDDGSVDLISSTHELIDEFGDPAEGMALSIGRIQKSGHSCETLPVF